LNGNVAVSRNTSSFKGTDHHTGPCSSNAREFLLIIREAGGGEGCLNEITGGPKRLSCDSVDYCGQRSGREENSIGVQLSYLTGVIINNVDTLSLDQDARRLLEQ
jgi:hypothetical protein